MCACEAFLRTCGMDTPHSAIVQLFGDENVTCPAVEISVAGHVGISEVGHI